MTLTVEEQQELRALCDQAIETRNAAPAYTTDASQAIEVWWQRRALRALERDQERQARLIRLLRETDPTPLPEGQRSLIDRTAA
jgi:hypothetical protein